MPRFVNVGLSGDVGGGAGGSGSESSGGGARSQCIHPQSIAVHLLLCTA